MTQNRRSLLEVAFLLKLKERYFAASQIDKCKLGNKMVRVLPPLDTGQAGWDYAERSVHTFSLCSLGASYKTG